MRATRVLWAVTCISSCAAFSGPLRLPLSRLGATAPRSVSATRVARAGAPGRVGLRHGARMQVSDFGDSPDDVMAYMKKRDEAQKAAAQTGSTAPFGAWESPITSKSLTEAVVGLGETRFDSNGDLYWVESRPTEGGRSVIVKRDTQSGSTMDVTPMGFNARTRVHEYGGGAFTVSQGVVYFSNFQDQRLYAQLAFPGAEPLPLTPEGKLRFADAAVDAPRERLICVVEDHSAGEKHPRNYIAAVSMNGDEGTGFPEIKVLVEGADFYASPRLSDDGSKLAWIGWDHPNMPWDGTRLFVADVAEDGSVRVPFSFRVLRRALAAGPCAWQSCANGEAGGQVGEPRLVAGGDSESITSPAFDPFGDLYYVRDRPGCLCVCCRALFSRLARIFHPEQEPP